VSYTTDVVNPQAVVLALPVRCQKSAPEGPAGFPSRTGLVTRWRVGHHCRPGVPHDLPDPLHGRKSPVQTVLRGRADGRHLTDTPACAAAGRASSCLVRRYLGLSPAPEAADQAAVVIRTDTRSELACDAFRQGCCCTLLPYFAAVRAPGTLWSDFRII